MSITLNSSTTNNADWKTQFEFRDAKTDELIDFTGASIAIEIWDNECRLVRATTDDKIAIISTGLIELDVSASEMNALCAGSYNIGGVYFLNGETISLFTGTLAIRKGYANV